MIIETARIVLAVGLVCFHRPIAEFMHVREQELTAYLGRRGYRMPTFSSVAMTTTVYFYLGLGFFVLAIARLWLPV
jgi:hypothetical protein